MALQASKDVLINAKTNAEYQASEKTLREVMNALELKGDTAILSALLNELNVLNQSDFTQYSWEIFEDVRNHAREIIANDNSTQKEIDTAKQDLMNAKAALKYRVDIAALTALIERTNVLSQSDYTVDSWNRFLDARNHAIQMIADDSRAQDEVNTAYQELNDSLNELLLKADTGIADLITLLEQAKALNQSDYTIDSWAVFIDELDRAEAIISNNNSTQNEISAAKQDLIAAQAALKFQVSAAALTVLIERSNALNQSDYTADSWTRLVDARNHAQQIIADNSRTQDEINTAYQKLFDAKADLIMDDTGTDIDTDDDTDPGTGTSTSTDPDTAALTALIERANELNQSYYTEDSWARLIDARNYAKLMIADHNRTQDEINTAYQKLNDAKDELAFKTESDD